MVIPAKLRQALGLKPGDEVIMDVEDGELRLFSRARALRRAQEFVRTLVPAGVSLADELIRERREEAVRE